MKWVYDVETFKNIFTAIFKNVDSGDVKTFVVYADENGNVIRDDSESLVEFITQDDLTLIGHNSLHFDDIVLTAFLHYPVKPLNLYNLAGKLIKDEEFEQFRASEVYKELKYSHLKKWKSIDTMAVTRVNQQRLGLKYAAIVLQHDRLQDLPFDPSTFIAEDQIELMLSYNLNDVVITHKLYDNLYDVLQLRRDITEVFEVDVETANDTEIAKNILNTLYAEKTGQKYSEFKDLRSPKARINYIDCISPLVHFVTPEFKALRKELEKVTLYEIQDFKFKKIFVFDGIKYKLGVGGLHSVDTPAKFESCDEFRIADQDFQSFYPNIMIQNRFYPEHLGEIFLDIFEELVTTRVKAKELGKTDKFQAIMAYALKIAINSVFGLMKLPYYWLYAPKAIFSVTISGQLILLDMVEKLYLEGISVISANTDGIVCKIPKDKEDAYYRVIKDVETRIGIKLEETKYTKYIRRDVNSYITVKPDGAVKTKGAFSPGKWDGRKWQQPLVKGYYHPIVPISIYKYFVEGHPIADTIRNHNNIHDFMVTQRVSSQFDVMFSSLVEGELQVEKQQKTNRMIVTKTGGIMQKTDGDRNLSIIAGKPVQILNDVDSTNPKDYDLDYNWYIDQAYKIVDLVEPPQPDLF